MEEVYAIDITSQQSENCIYQSEHIPLLISKQFSHAEKLGCSTNVWGFAFIFKGGVYFRVAST
jgi:hypothetical protein